MVGIDIVDVARVRQAVKRYGDRFLSKILTDQEIDYINGINRREESIAGRFAAKEAFMKAMGKRLSWKDINVLHKGGKPYIEFRGESYSGVSISHERSYAVSVVMIKQGGSDEQ